MIRTLKHREAKRINIDRVRYIPSVASAAGPHHGLKRVWFIASAMLPQFTTLNCSAQADPGGRTIRN
ncbi:MAG: hypothetical protein ACK5Q5_08350 [Planctomycetaceae bacterium]